MITGPGMNEVILSKDNLPLKRFFIDHQMYQDGSTFHENERNVFGLVASMVLRCDDCILLPSWQMS